MTDKHFNDELLISKTDLKKSAQELQSLGEELIQLNETQLSTLPLVDILLNEIKTAKKIKASNALNRQIRYIGRLIGKTDTEAIQVALEKLRQKSGAHEQTTLKTEQWRDRLLSKDSHAISHFIDQYPHCDRQKLNQLVRASIKEQLLNETALPKKISKQKKALFIFLRNNISDA